MEKHGFNPQSKWRFQFLAGKSMEINGGKLL